MADIEPQPSGKGTCRFATGRLRPLLGAFSQEIDGVKAAQDSEFIHRMRVASRRLRAALPLFAGCFPDKKYRCWMQEIKKITRALGRARDADVQIEFLHGYTGTLNDQQEKKNRTRPSKDLVKAEIQALLLQLKSRRATYQTKVLSNLSELKESRILEDMHDELRADQFVVRGIKKQYAAGIPAVAADRIGTRLNRFLAYEPWVADPDAVAEHHAMRIAAKKLRYTLEVYSPLYKLQLKKPLARVKKVQALLGDLHDCDVWIDTLSHTLLKQRSLPRTRRNPASAGTHNISGIKALLLDREKKRRALHRRIVQYWGALNRSRIWDELRITLVSGRKKAYCLRSQADEDDARTAVALVAADYPQGEEHARHVTGLALMLFDQVQPLHNLQKRERFLLECTGLLHDIGWMFGQKGHQLRSARMIAGDERLPFDLRERAIISLAALSHRKDARLESNGLFSVLPKADCDVIQVLAAILRVADGLDYLHLSTVLEVRCSIHPDEIICETATSGDATVEVARALLKADLFEQVFCRPLVIR